MDPTLILLVVALGAFIVFQVFQGRKRKRETEERQLRFVPGTEIMTNYGLYGTILTLDDDTNVATIETTPGTVLKIHRQTILKVADYEVVPVDEDVVVADEVEGDSTVTDADIAKITGEPEYGQRTTTAEPVDGTDTADGDVRHDAPTKKNDE